MIHRELVVPNDTQYLAQVRQEVTKVVEQSAFTERDRKLIIVAVDEAVTNIMEHAYDNDLEGELDIELILEYDNTRFEVVIRDSGKEFDPRRLEVVNVPEHVRKGSRHGLGIFLIRQIMDEVNYNFIQGLRNELQMIKYVDRSKRAVPGAK
jgi:anti-sigma regulatory factor (Ser/Thr protein kinase)